MDQRRFDLQLPVDVRSAGEARHAVRETLDGSVDEDIVTDVELLVTELVSNGVRHGSAGAEWIEVHLRLEPAEVLVEVEDRGPGFDPLALPPVADPGTTGGWGLALVQRIADRWGTRSRRHGFSVWFSIDRTLSSC